MYRDSYRNRDGNFSIVTEDSFGRNMVLFGPFTSFSAAAQVMNHAMALNAALIEVDCVPEKMRISEDLAPRVGTFNQVLSQLHRHFLTGGCFAPSLNRVGQVCVAHYAEPGSGAQLIGTPREICARLLSRNDFEASAVEVLDDAVRISDKGRQRTLTIPTSSPKDLKAELDLSIEQPAKSADLRLDKKASHLSPSM